MNRVYLKKSDSSVAALLNATFPDYNGKNIVATVSDTVRFYNTQWDSGSKRSYCIVKLNGLQVCSIAEAPFLKRDALYETDHAIPEGYVVVVHANCRWEHVEIIAPASAITPMLPAPVDLTDDEKTVLIATRSLKSSYNGIPNYRFVEAKRARGITLERWEAAKTSLIDKKFLNKAGAITVEGKNVCPNEYL